MTFALLAVLTIAGLPAVAEPPQQSTAAQQITDARLALSREDLALVLALPPDVPKAAASDPQCPQPYKSYRDSLDDFAGKVVDRMHRTKDIGDARAQFDGAYSCAVKLARAADPDPESFQARMYKKITVAQAQLGRLGSSERKELVAQLSQDRIGQQRVDKSVQSALAIVKQLQDPRLADDSLDNLSGQVKDAGAKRFAQDWLNNPVYASEFRPTPSHYRSLAVAPVPAAAAAATPAPVSTSKLADFIADVSSISRNYTRKVQAYAQKVSDAIVNSSTARSIDARLSAAVVWAESNFHFQAQSWADCVGLGQLSRGVADAYRVTNREDINQNLRATTGYLRDLIKQFATKQDQLDLQAAFASKADDVQKAMAGGQSKQQAIDQAFSDLWPRIPYGMKNALAAYNAGPNAITRVGGWDRLPLPPNGCAHRPAKDNSYCQTAKYVPRVLKNYFTVFVETSDHSPELFASARQSDQGLQTVAVSAHYRATSPGGL